MVLVTVSVFTEMSTFNMVWYGFTYLHSGISITWRTTNIYKIYIYDMTETFIGFIKFNIAKFVVILTCDMHVNI